MYALLMKNELTPYFFAFLHLSDSGILANENLVSTKSKEGLELGL